MSDTLKAIAARYAAAMKASSGQPAGYSEAENRAWAAQKFRDIRQLAERECPDLSTEDLMEIAKVEAPTLYKWLN